MNLYHVMCFPCSVLFLYFPFFLTLFVVSLSILLYLLSLRYKIVTVVSGLVRMWIICLYTHYYKSTHADFFWSVMHIVISMKHVPPSITGSANLSVFECMWCNLYLWHVWMYLGPLITIRTIIIRIIVIKTTI